MGGVWLLTFFGERILLLDLIVPLPGATLELWVADFMQGAAAGIWIAGFGTLVWFVLARWAFPVSDWKTAGRRWIWLTIGVITVIICTVWGFYSVPLAKNGDPVAYFFFFVNAALIYYLSTTLASPPSYKYTPVGAKVLRAI